MILITIGRNQGNKIVINNQSVSGLHAEVKVKDDGSIFLIDKSTNGTVVRGLRVEKDIEIPVNRGDKVTFAGVADLDWSKIPTVAPPPPGWQVYSIGSDLNNRILINDSTGYISRFHATLKVDPKGRMFLNDHSSNGTFVNGTRIQSNTDFPVKRKDQIMLANTQPLDWNKIKGGGGSSINPWHIIIPVAAAVVIGFGIFMWKMMNDDWGKYQSATSLIYHAFYYDVKLEDDGLVGTLTYGMKDNGEPELVAIDKEFIVSSPKPFEISGTGFFITDNGKIVTNKHVAVPWAYLDKTIEDQIRNAVNYFLNNAQGFQSDAFKRIADGKNADMLNAQIRRLRNNTIRSIGGQTVTIRIGFYDYYYESIEKFEPCKVLITSDKNDIDLAILQTNDKKLPSSVKTIVDVTNAESVDNKLKVGDQLVYIGYPKGLAINYRPEEGGLKPIVKYGNLQRDPSNISFDINAEILGGASGSPVFNTKKQLVGVVNSGYNSSSTFGKGILAKHIKKLLDETK